jgi:plastocyanin
MRHKKIIIILVIVFVISVVTGSFIGLQSSKPALVKRADTTYVSLVENKAVPDAVIVKKGEYVQFNSNDGNSHNLTLGKGDSHNNSHDHVGLIESGVFKADEAYRLQFKKVGTYTFHDHTNPKIYITVIVYDPTDSSRIQ